MGVKKANERVREATENQDEMREHMDKAIQEKIQFKIHSGEKREKLEIMTEENKNLRMKL